MTYLTINFKTIGVHQICEFGPSCLNTQKGDHKICLKIDLEIVVNVL